jgi:hypothetical protein
MKRLKNYYSFLREAQETSNAPVPGEEVVLTGGGDSIEILFGEGKFQITSDLKKSLKDSLAHMMRRYQNFEALIKFLGTSTSKSVPPIFLIEVGTSHTGGGNINRDVAEGRLKSMRDLLIETLNEKPAGGNLRQDKALMLIVDDQKYKPSATDTNFVDTTTKKPDWWERYGRIQVNKFLIEGLTTNDINVFGNLLRKAKGMNINPDEGLIVQCIKALQTYSDITDLDKNIEGGLQNFLNSTITDGLTSWGSDTKEREEIKSHLNKISNKSGKGDVAQVANDKITLDLKR